MVSKDIVDTTALLITFANKGYPEDPEVYVPSIFDVESVPVVVNNETTMLSLWDAAKQESYDQIRQSGNRMSVLYSFTCLYICSISRC